VPLKNYYALLEVAAGAPLDEIKKAFRQQIARYHPDKVQHLGREFQSMAADRAAELTEAYRILSDAGRRAEYDRAGAAAGGLPTSHPAAASPSPAAEPSQQPAPSPTPEPPPQTSTSAQFTRERASRDVFVRKATMTRLRQALEAVGGGYDESPVPGFDIACVPKSKLFARSKNPRLLGRFISRLDREAVADAWQEAAKWGVPAGDDVCVLLMGTSLAPARELAAEISDQRRKQRKGGKLTLIPVDASVWDAHMPFDAPEVAKTLLARLKSGA
jgi:curved DNA-binding protein CbpA